MQTTNNTAQLIINGLPVHGDKVSDVINPATEQVMASCSRASAAQIDRAVAAAKSAYPSWANTPLSDRSAILSSMADRIEENAEELACLLTQEGGCPLEYTKYEIGGLVAGMHYFASLSLEPEVLEDSGERRARIFRRPLGVVAAICAWNFPIDILSAKLSPALLAGNTVVVKPAGTTPLTTLRIAALVQDLLPPGVFNAVADENDMGEVLTSHADVRKITFTGSTLTGKRVCVNAAQNLTRLTLELGGNDVAIVLDDANISEIIDNIFFGAFFHNGQNCIGIKRLYTQEGIYEELCKELIARCEASVIGDGLDEKVNHGPLQNKTQFVKAKRFLEDARKHGRLLCGGKAPDRPGYFMEPTLVTDIAEGTKLVDEEQFCPVLPILTFKDDEEVIKRANASSYGLAGSVWTSDKARGFAVAERLETGMVWVNKYADILHHLIFNGAKHSGYGAELGVEGLKEFTQMQMINELP